MVGWATVLVRIVIRSHSHLPPPHGAELRAAWLATITRRSMTPCETAWSHLADHQASASTLTTCGRSHSQTARTGARSNLWAAHRLVDLDLRRSTTPCATEWWCLGATPMTMPRAMLP